MALKNIFMVLTVLHILKKIKKAHVDVLGFLIQLIQFKLLAQIFETNNSLNNLENFVSKNGAFTL